MASLCAPQEKGEQHARGNVAGVGRPGVGAMPKTNPQDRELAVQLMEQPLPRLVEGIARPARRRYALADAALVD